MWIPYVNKENADMIFVLMRRAGDNLKGRLPPSRNHPGGRNPYAHVATCIKQKFGMSYKDVPDGQFSDLVQFIQYIEENPM